MLSYSLAQKLWVLYLNLIGWFKTITVQTFRPLIVIYRKVNFEYIDWECTSIYRPLSYPFRYLKITMVPKVLIRKLKNFLVPIWNLY